MDLKGIMAGFSILVLAFFVACTPEKVSQIQAIGPDQVKGEKGSQAIIKEAWELEWEKTLQAARKEGRVVVWGSSAVPAVKEVAPLFNKKYGLAIEAIAMDRAAILTARLFQERRAGLYLPDVLLTGMNNALNETIPAGAVDPLEPTLILPEVLDPKSWFGGELPWGDKNHMVFMAYAFPNTSLATNTELVKKEEIKSWYDLLNPKWKDKMVMNDPTVTGTGLKSFSVLGWAILNLDYFRQLARQEPVIIRDQRLQVEWLAKGKYPVLLFPRPGPMTEYISAGAPLAYVIPQEGTYLSRGGGNISLVNRAPHPNAAKIFINWFLSKEGQTLVTAVEGVQSGRMDVPTEGLDPLKIRQPGIKYFMGADTKEFLSRDAEYIKSAQEIFGHLMK